jgi:hypothetical protein
MVELRGHWLECEEHQSNKYCNVQADHDDSMNLPDSLELHTLFAQVTMQEINQPFSFESANSIYMRIS